jgi:hypothetical protein
MSLAWYLDPGVQTPSATNMTCCDARMNIRLTLQRRTTNKDGVKASGIKSLRATLPAEIFNWYFNF